jgi:DNA-binding IclR family transcriptional regulator
MDGANVSPIQTLNKAVAVLNLLADKGELTPTQIAKHLGEPRSSIYRLIGGLSNHELVAEGSRRSTYRLGIGLLRLGGLVAERFDVHQAALPAMQTIHEQTGETIYLCIRRGFSAVCIERLAGERVQLLALRLGGSMPLHVGGAPLALLAFESDEFQQEYLSTGDLTPILPAKSRTVREIKEELERVRQGGVAIGDEDITPGIAAIGAPVFGLDGKVQAAISISGTKPLIMEEFLDRTVALVTEAARNTSVALGYEPLVA